MSMDCDSCEYIGTVGGKKVCGWFLQAGETIFIKNGKINEPCPKVARDRHNDLVSSGKIQGEKHEYPKMGQK